ncbi:MAG TPA: ATP-binding protein [Candidatus Sulfotelmatobacter sp.]|nr:ATP-binding protein [Candidatus Sulfotelmatobacter sp.]
MAAAALPAWARELEDRLAASTARVFILHYNVGDVVPVGDEYVPLRDFLGRWMGAAAPVLFYDRSRGLSFPDAEVEARFRRATGQGPDDEASPLEAQRRRALAALGERGAPRELPTHPAKVLGLLEQALRSGCLRREGQDRVVLAIEYAETVFPAADLAGMGDDDRTNLVTLLRWAADPLLARSGALVLLTTFVLADLHPRLRQPGSRVEAVEVPLPGEADRAAYVRHLLAGDGADLAMTPEQLAHATAGLSRLQIQALWRAARARGGPLSFEEVRRRKRDLLKQELADLVDLVEPEFGLEAIGGLEPVKAFLRQVIRAVREGDLKMVPRGITLVGPPGVGKTALAQALARECGFNFVKIVNPREKWVGQSERNFWRVLQALRALTPLVLLEDEADQSEQSRDEYSGDSGVGNRIRQMRFEFTGDPTIQGRVLWVRISNRPDKLDAAEKRSGRSSERIPLLMPDASDKASIFAVMPRKHGFPCALEDFGPAVEACERLHPGQISGADIEEMFFRAYRRARGRGAAAVQLDDLVWAVEDFIPSQTREAIEQQERLALSLCSSRQFLPDRYRDVFPPPSPAPPAP